MGTGLRQRFFSSFVPIPAMNAPPARRMVATFVLSAMSMAVTVQAAEPAEAFLLQLRNAGYYDVALAYLDRIDQQPGVEADFRSAVDFERAQIQYDLAKSSRNPDERNEYLEQSEKGLISFSKNSPEHPRLAEARLQLGLLQMKRGELLMLGEPGPEQREKAREAFLAAGETFSTIVEQLRTDLKAMRGAQIDPSKDRDAAARRDRMRGEFLVGLVRSSEARKLAAETYPDPAKGGKALLEQALKDFEELASKYSDYVQGVTANLYAGEILEKLGKPNEAEAKYTEMVEAPAADELRDAKYRAASGLVRLAMAKSPPDFATAIATAEKRVGDVRPNERRTPSVNELKLALAEAWLTKSKADSVDKKDQKKALSEGRSTLNQIAKIPGPHLDKAKSLLADLGVTVGDDEVEAATASAPESLDDALAKARPLLQAAAELEQQLRGEAGKDELGLGDQLAETRGIAIDLLRQGLAMVNNNTDASLANQARQYLALTLLQAEQHHGAVAVGGFLSRIAPGTDAGLNGGLIALNGVRTLLQQNESDEGLAGELSRLANHLSQTWPDNDEAAGAKAVLVQLAMKNGRYDKAESLIGEMPDGPAKGSLQRLLGRVVYADSVQQSASGEDGKAKAVELVGRSEKILTDGLKNIAGNLADADAAKAALTLAKAKLKQGDTAAAIGTLSHPTYGPLTLADKLKIDDESFRSDLYQTQLRATVSSITGGGGSATLEDATAAMEKLQSVNQGPDSERRLAAIYMSMASDIREQLDAAPPAQKQTLTEAFRVFLERMTATTDNASTLQWAGQTLVSLAEAAMPAGATKATGPAKQLLDTAIQTYDKLQSVQNNVPLTTQYYHARAMRMAGQYKAALDQLENVLGANPRMIDAQFEAAQAYEDWAAEVQPKFRGNAYRAALQGGRPGGPKKENVIWGWGKISQTVSRNPNFRDRFFDARYHVALTRLKWGKAENNKQLIDQAATDINKVAALYPDLGGPESFKRFDQLYRRIEKEQGKPVTGLPKPPNPGGMPPQDAADQSPRNATPAVAGAAGG